MESEATSKTQGSVVPKACENCRTRKIRCNRVIPCSNCLSSGITCRPARAVEHRPRILVSNNYEKQIELIGERLNSIEHSLRNLSISGAKQRSQSQDGSLPASDDATPAPVQFEGLSSFQQQSIQATELAEMFGGNPTQELSNAIKSLKDLISVTPESSSITQQLFVEGNKIKNPDFDLLPANFTIPLLKKMRDTQTISLFTSGIRDSIQLERICQKAYFPTEPLALGEQTAMFGMFYCLIQEMVLLNDPIVKEHDYDDYMQRCRRGIFTGIQTYEILTVPSYWNIVSLMIAATMALEERRTSLAFTLNSAACRHAQSLGFHREAILQQDDYETSQRKRFLFWTIYSMDKSLALTSGRASSLPDYDIDTEFFKPSNIPSQRAWDSTTLLFTKIARVQGQVYEQLYSSSGMKKSGAEKSAIIERLATELTRHQEALRTIDRTGVFAPQMLEMLITPSEVIYHSLLTIIYRASSNIEEGAVVSSKCFASARKALETHLELFPRFSSAGDFMIGVYVNWILLYCSFTPFVVVFLHATASQSQNEIELLEKVTASLEKTRFIADDIERLYQTCLIFCRVARAIVESRQNLVRFYNEESNSFGFPDLSQQLQSSSQGNMVGCTSTSSSINEPRMTSSSMTTAATTGMHPQHQHQSHQQQQHPSQQQQQQHQPQQQFSTHQPTFYPFNQLPEYFAQEHGVLPTSDDIGEMSTFFGNWVGGNQPVMDLLNMDLSVDVD